MTLLFSTAPFASVTVGSPHAVTTTAAAISPPSTSEEHRSALPADALRSGDDIAHVPQRAATNAFRPLDAYHTMPSDSAVASLYHHRHGCSSSVMGSEGLSCCCCGCGCSDEGKCTNNNSNMTSGVGGGNAYSSAQRLPAAHLSASRPSTQQVPSWPMVPSATGFAAAAAGEAPSAATPMRMAVKESRCVACGQAAMMSNAYSSGSGGAACQAGCLCATNAAVSAMLTTNNSNSRMQRAATDASAFMSHALRERNEASETGGSGRLVPPLPISPSMHSRTSYAAVPSNSNPVYSNGYSYPHPYNNGNNNSSALYGDPMYEPDEKERLGRLHIAFKSLSKAERQRRVEAEAAATDLLARTVHLRFLPPCMFQHELAALCAACGEYLRIRICGNGQRNQNWIYGFVEFATRDGAVRMMQQSGRELYNGPTRPPLRLRCSAAKHPIVDRVFHDADPANKTLCIFGLGSYANRTLRDALESYTHLKEKEALLQRAQQEQQQQPCVEQPCLSMTALSTSTGNNTRPSSTLNGVEEGEETEEATCVRANELITPSCLTERRNSSDTCAPSPVCSLAASLHHYAAPYDRSALTAAEATTTTTTAAAMTPTVRLETTQTGSLPHTLSPATTSASCTIAGPQEQPLVHPLPLRTEATTTMTTTLLPGARNTAQLLQYMMSQETTAIRDNDVQAAMWCPWDMRDCAEASAPGDLPSQAQGSHYNKNNSNRMDAAMAGSVGDKENMTSDHDGVSVTCNSMASCMRTAAPLQPCAARLAPVCEAVHMSAIPAMNAATRQAASRELSARAAPFVPMTDLATASLTLQPAYMPTGQDMLRTTQGITLTSGRAKDGMAGAYKTHEAQAAMSTQTTPHNITHDVHHPRRASSQLPISPYAMAADKSTHSNSSSSSDSGAVSEMGCQLSCMLEHVMRSRGGSDGEEVLERARLLMLRALRHCVNATNSQLDFCNTVGTLHSLLELLREQAVLTGGPAQTSIADCARHLPQRTTQLQLLANLLLALLWLARRHLGKALPYVHAVVTCCNDIPLQPLSITQGVPEHVTSSCCCCCGVSCPSSRAAMSTDDMSGQDGVASAKSCAKVTSDTDMAASEAVLPAAVQSHASPSYTSGGTSHDAQPTTTTAIMADTHDDMAMAAAEEGEESHSGLHRRVTSDELLHAVLDTLGSSSRSSNSSNSSSDDDDVDKGEVRQRHNVTALHLSPTCDACLGGEQVTQSPMTRALPPSEEQQQQAQSTRDVAFHCHVLHVLLCVGLAMELVEPAVAKRTYALAAHRARAVLGMSCAVLDAWLTETTSTQPLSSASSSSATCVTPCVNNNSTSSSSSGLLAKMWQSTGSNSSSSSNDNSSSGAVCEAVMADITTFPRLFFRSVASQLPRLMGSQAAFWHELPPSACMRCFRCSQVET